ncbi:polynucleotide adenylyltransferase [Coemansia helicoidea]|uniref:Polynucleotide adenylyltransferase n=1 Tax=Coemansia helicoidea TaxID=1286919 RepID=A0ACC1LC25_9FUNG|nr:polynucleotide adenylyltransferase [Coemansia helicoidea]
MERPRYLGVTPPVDTTPSSAEEEALADELLATLKAQGQFESDSERRSREVILGKIDKMLKEFVYRAAIKYKRPESVARSYGGKIFTFGSYRLGVHGAGADLDTLCVVPSHVQRSDFFEIMVEMLRERSEVTKLTPVPETHVPVIKMEFSGVDIDMTVAVLQQPVVPEDQDLADNNLLRNMDPVSVRSLNGSRVTDEILRLVPSIPTFRLALRCIKLWAKRRAIYSNSMGFFGGVAWAMLVARICQLYPNKSASIIVTRFFHILLRWNWPTPIQLKTIETGSGNLHVWNPQTSLSDAAHRMPIITPAYPSMCATHTVSHSTKQLIVREISHGVGVADRIMRREATWDAMFEKDDFFRTYKFYLQVNVASTDAEAHNLMHGFLESRLRQYVTRLEHTGMFVLIHPYMNSFDREHPCATDEDEQQVRAGLAPEERPAASNTDGDGAGGEAPSSDKDGKTVSLTTFYLGLLLTDRDRGANGKRCIDLSLPTQDFIMLIKDTELWDNDHMTISIRFLRQEQLPDEVFGDGPRDRLRSPDSKGKSKSKKRKRHASAVSGNGQAAAEAGQSPPGEDRAKKARVADAQVPSTSGVAVTGSSGDVPAPAAAEGDGQKQQPAPGAGPAVLPPQVPPPAKTGGIRLKLL